MKTNLKWMGQETLWCHCKRKKIDITDTMLYVLINIWLTQDTVAAIKNMNSVEWIQNWSI